VKSIFLILIICIFWALVTATAADQDQVKNQSPKRAAGQTPNEASRRSVMKPKDWAIITFAALTLVWSIIAFWLTQRGNRSNKVLAERALEHADKSNAIAERAREQADKSNAIAELSGRRLTAESEISLLRLINDARMRVNDINLQITNLQQGETAGKLSAAETRHVQKLTLAWEDSYEVLLNAYELACGMYLDDKLDKERFKRQYHDELRGLMSSTFEPVRNRLHRPDTPYRAFRKVYDQWFNLETDRQDI
jgi:hypothetical protein